MVTGTRPSTRSTEPADGVRVAPPSRSCSRPSPVAGYLRRSRDARRVPRTSATGSSRATGGPSRGSSGRAQARRPPSLTRSRAPDTGRLTLPPTGSGRRRPPRRVRAPQSSAAPAAGSAASASTRREVLGRGLDRELRELLRVEVRGGLGLHPVAGRRAVPRLALDVHLVRVGGPLGPAAEVAIEHGKHAGGAAGDPGLLTDLLLDRPPRAVADVRPASGERPARVADLADEQHTPLREHDAPHVDLRRPVAVLLGEAHGELRGGLAGDARRKLCGDLADRLEAPPVERVLAVRQAASRNRLERSRQAEEVAHARRASRARAG